MLYLQDWCQRLLKHVSFSPYFLQFSSFQYDPFHSQECWALSIKRCSRSFPITKGVRSTPHPYSVLVYVWFFILCKSDHRRLSSGCVKCLESTIMSFSIKNRPKVVYKQAKVALDSLAPISLIAIH